jgi:hypothetical protein
MNIPVEQFAKKIEKHVAEIRRLGEASPKMREHVCAIQALCELMLEADDEAPHETKEWLPSHPVQAPKSMVTATSLKKRKKSAMDYDLEDYDYEEEDGNGDSIFDF